MKETSDELPHQWPLELYCWLRLALASATCYALDEHAEWMEAEELGGVDVYDGPDSLTAPAEGWPAGWALDSDAVTAPRYDPGGWRWRDDSGHRWEARL